MDYIILDNKKAFGLGINNIINCLKNHGKL